MKGINLNKSVLFKDTKTDLELLQFVNRQDERFSPYVKGLIREKLEQTTHGIDISTVLLKEILTELAEIKKQLNSMPQSSSTITHETIETEAKYDERDLSGLDDF